MNMMDEGFLSTDGSIGSELVNCCIIDKMFLANGCWNCEKVFGWWVECGCWGIWTSWNKFFVHLAQFNSLIRIRKIQIVDKKWMRNRIYLILNRRHLFFLKKNYLFYLFICSPNDRSPLHSTILLLIFVHKFLTYSKCFYNKEKQFSF